MAHPTFPSLQQTDLDGLAEFEGAVAVLVDPDARLDANARRLNRLTKGAVARAVESDEFEDLAEGSALGLSFCAGISAKLVLITKLRRRADANAARFAGGAIGRARRADPVLVLAGACREPAALAQGLTLSSYRFDVRKSETAEAVGPSVVMVNKVDDFAQAWIDAEAVASGTMFTRDLVNEPANHLTTSAFASRLSELGALGLKIEVLEEAELEALGMHALLGVGLGSETPSKVVVMTWNGGAKDTAPIALVGKGVVFDTGGISMKPAAGMEDMTMDMGGAGVVGGVMQAIAARKAKANVVGLVGLVENMPDGRAQRPGDVVTSMKGDTIEVINTDAEGRLVLCDVMWYAQERFKPAAMIDLATLTGAIIIGLGHEKAGVFSNDDAFAAKFLTAASRAAEGAWQMPLDPAYDAQLKSHIADMKNVGGRPAGSITAAQFLARFVKPEVPWIHLDIAGVASLKSPSKLAPKGATGWGVRALDQLIRSEYED